MKPKQPVPPPTVLDPAKFYITSAELVCVYAAPQPSWLAENIELVELVPLTISGLAYSYDLASAKYHWTVQRPLCENRQRFLDKLRGLARLNNGELSLGIAFNGTREAPPAAQRRGLWLPHLKDLHGAMSFGPQGPITDVVAGTCDEPELWPSPPPFPTKRPEY